MKLHGVTIVPPKPIPIVLPRNEGDIVLYAAPILSLEDFEKLCPRPKPPSVMRPGKGYSVDTNSKEYIQAMSKWGEQKSNYLIIKSLSDGTPDLEWDNVDLTDPDTWAGYETELTSVFTIGEVDIIVGGCFAANLPTDDRQKEALERFMSPQEEDNPSTYRKDAQNSTTSGELVKDSD